jgi:hypothetical protein
MRAPRLQGTTASRIRRAGRHATREMEISHFENDDQQCGSRFCSPTFGHDLHRDQIELQAPIWMACTTKCSRYGWSVRVAFPAVPE